MNESAVLTCENLAKSYGHRRLFSALNFSLNPKERLALLGASGSGKSTLLHCLSGVTPFDEGEVTLAGAKLSSMSPDTLAECRRERIGTVFQFFHLLPTLTAFENVELPLQLIGMPETERRERVNALLQRMGIPNRSDAFPAALSGGEMQRVAIARAIAHRPAILFADEPTGNLDRRSGEAVLQLLQEITEEEGAALLMVTHSDDAAAICQSKLRLEEGNLLPA